MSSDLDFEHIWQWADKIYAKNQTLCLSLQDEHGVNVNLLLLCSYLDSQARIYYQPNYWQNIVTELQHWENKLLTPYRKLRRLSKNLLEQDEYQRMLGVELMLERKSQRFIGSLMMTSTIPTGRINGKGNIDNYLSILGIHQQNIKLQLE
ncbi:MAG: TIGR02444 family protein [Parashewanella sp.]